MPKTDRLSILVAFVTTKELFMGISPARSPRMIGLNIAGKTKIILSLRKELQD